LKTAVIAGSSGLIGRECLRLLLERSDYTRVVALVRRRQGLADPPNKEKYEELITTFDDLGSLAPIPADHAFCALGTTIRKAGSKEAFARVDRDYVANFAYWARAGGAEAICVVSSVGADASSGNFYLAVKGEMEEGVAEQRFPSTHIMRPSVLLGSREESRSGERIAAATLKILNPLLVGPLRNYRAIQADTVAAAMVAAANSGQLERYVHFHDGIEALAKTH